MLRWALWHASVWAARFIVTIVAVLSMTHLVNTELGYRMEVVPMFFIAAITIATLRVWMPWTKPDLPLNEQDKDRR